MQGNNIKQSHGVAMSHSQKNTPNGDQSSDRSEKQVNNAELKAENRERGEASGLITDGSLNKDIQASTLEKRLSRKSGATGYGVASADSLLPTEAEIQQLGKQLMAKLEEEKPLAIIAQNIGETNPLLPQTTPIVTDANNAAGSDRVDVVAQGFNIPNPVDVYKREVEHKYRGRELETMNRDIPAKAWEEAYRAFPELRQIGEKNSIKLMKAIIANELDHYGPEDLAQDEIAKTGHGGQLVGNRSLGYPQIEPAGIRNMSKAFSQEMAEQKRHSNPLQPFDRMNSDQLAQELTNPANAPLFVAAHMARDLQTLNNHKNELDVDLQALGYLYNADVVYAQNDSKHEHPISKKESQKKHIPAVAALPTQAILSRSEHATNLKNWLGKVR